MSESKISWTDTTWEIVLGCTRVSAGCQHCYAERLTHRFSQNPVFKNKYDGLIKIGTNGPAWNGTVRVLHDELMKPLSWKKPRKVFVCSRSDLFHKDVPFDFIAAVFGVMAATPQHTYQILTKRPERMAEFFAQVKNVALSPAAQNWLRDSRRPEHAWEVLLCMEHFARKTPAGTTFVENVSKSWPLANVWLGTSVEDQKAANERIPHLVKCPAVVRFVSVEPLLGEVNLLPWLADIECLRADCDWQGFRNNNVDSGGLRFDESEVHEGEDDYFCPECGASEERGEVGSTEHAAPFGKNSGRDNAPLLDWVIVGGESGADARPMDMRWARTLRDQCRNAGVAFYFKQQVGFRSNEKPYLVEEDGSCFKIQQYPVNEIGGLQVTGEPRKVQP